MFFSAASSASGGSTHVIVTVYTRNHAMTSTAILWQVVRLSGCPYVCLWRYCARS